MSERFHNSPKIIDAMQHAKDLDAHARKELGTEAEDSYSSRAVYINSVNDTFKLNYVSPLDRLSTGLAQDRARNNLANKTLSMLGKRSLLGSYASIRREAFVSGEQEEIKMSHALEYGSLSHLLSRPQGQRTRSWVTMDQLETLDPDDPRLQGTYGLESFSFYPQPKRVEVSSLERIEQRLDEFLDLTPSQLFIPEFGKPTTEQNEALLNSANQSITSIFKENGVDVNHAKKEATLKFKYGGGDVSLHYSPTMPTGESIPSAFVKIESGQNYLATIVRFNKEARRYGLYAEVVNSQALKMTQLDSLADISYVTELLEILAQHPTFARMDNADTDYATHAIERELQPVVPSSPHVKDITDFIKEHTS